MKRMVAVAVACLLSASLLGAVDAAPTGRPGQPSQQGLENARKVMQFRLERDKKMREVKKKGQEKRKETGEKATGKRAEMTDTGQVAGLLR